MDNIDIYSGYQERIRSLGFAVDMVSAIVVQLDSLVGSADGVVD